MIKSKNIKYASITDEQLILRFQQGDVDCFEELVLRYKDPLLNFVFRYMKNRVESEDIVQETFLRVFKNKHYYKEIAKFSTWIYTIAGNLAKTELRQKKRRKALSISAIMKDDKDFEIPDSDHNPEEEVDDNIKGVLIHKAIDKLPSHFKEVILMRDVRGFAYEEIANIIKIPIGTVKSRVNRGRLRLQEDLYEIYDVN